MSLPEEVLDQQSTVEYFSTMGDAVEQPYIEESLADDQHQLEHFYAQLLAGVDYTKPYFFHEDKGKWVEEQGGYYRINTGFIRRHAEEKDIIGYKLYSPSAPRFIILTLTNKDKYLKVVEKLQDSKPSFINLNEKGEYELYYAFENPFHLKDLILSLDHNYPGWLTDFKLTPNGVDDDNIRRLPLGKGSRLIHPDTLEEIDCGVGVERIHYLVDNYLFYDSIKRLFKKYLKKQYVNKYNAVNERFNPIQGYSNIGVVISNPDDKRWAPMGYYEGNVFNTNLQLYNLDKNLGKEQYASDVHVRMSEDRRVFETPKDLLFDYDTRKGLNIYKHATGFWDHMEALRKKTEDEYDPHKKNRTIVNNVFSKYQINEIAKKLRRLPYFRKAKLSKRLEKNYLEFMIWVLAEVVKHNTIHPDMEYIALPSTLLNSRYSRYEKPWHILIASGIIKIHSNYYNGDYYYKCRYYLVKPVLKWLRPVIRRKAYYANTTGDIANKVYFKDSLGTKPYHHPLVKERLFSPHTLVRDLSFPHLKVSRLRTLLKDVSKTKVSNSLSNSYPNHIPISLSNSTKNPVSNSFSNSTKNPVSNSFSNPITNTIPIPVNYIDIPISIIILLYKSSISYSYSHLSFHPVINYYNILPTLRQYLPKDDRLRAIKGISGVRDRAYVVRLPVEDTVITAVVENKREYSEEYITELRTRLGIPEEMEITDDDYKAFSWAFEDVTAHDHQTSEWYHHYQYEVQNVSKVH